tara:strand:- start:24 stop:485 length:462 start_codon:yes stop_codon:yes gene_type:complete
MKLPMDYTPSGPTSMGPVTNKEIDMMNNMLPSRRNELEQRAYQTYMDALARLRRAEEEGDPNAMMMSGAPEAQNRLGMVRQQNKLLQDVQSGAITPAEAATITTGVTNPMGSGSTTDMEFDAYQRAVGALENLPEDINDLGSFLRNLRQKTGE